MSLSHGARLGPYEIIAAIGAGGMGEVYKARDTRLGRTVAIKVLPSGAAADPERRRRFEQEARAVAALNHPNILTVFDVGTYQTADVTTAASSAGAAGAGAAATPTPYVVMELLQGETLREMVSRRSPTQRQVIASAVQVAQGLDAAHAKGIVHRDLKPENLFITRRGLVKILDFGLAKLRPAQPRPEEMLQASTGMMVTEAGAIIGTVPYMSPEQAQGEPVDARTDIFSFGAVLYEMVTGRRAFDGDTPVSILSAILKKVPQPRALSSRACRRSWIAS